MNPLEIALNSSRETDIQSVIERFPSLIIQGRYACGNMVIPQFPIGQSYRCDFAFISVKSGICPMILVELAPPAVKIFNKSGNFTSQFHHELQQVRDWTQTYSEHYKSIQEDAQIRFGAEFAGLVAHGIVKGELYVGRRNELEAPINDRRWKGITEDNLPNLTIRTYDSLLERGHLCEPDHIQPRIVRMSDRILNFRKKA